MMVPLSSFSMISNMTTSSEKPVKKQN